MIEKHKDPKTRKEYLLATGVVEGVFFNELKQKKTYAGPNGPWTPTHSINLIVDGHRIGLGLTEKTSLRAKDVDDQYQDVVKGTEVSVVVEEGTEYKGTMQYNSRSSQITVITPAPAETAQQQSGGKSNFSGQKRDNSGVETGHALNGGLNLVRGGIDIEVVEASKLVHTLTVELKKEYAEKNPEMSEYDVGAMVGHAVLNATRDAEKIEQVEEIARQLLDDVVPAVSSFVKGTKTEKTDPKTSKKPNTRQKAPKVEKEPEPVENTEQDVDSFEDDEDVPF